MIIDFTVYIKVVYRVNVSEDKTCNFNKEHSILLTNSCKNIDIEIRIFTKNLIQGSSH